MARKEQPKPLLATKHDFVASLDALIQQAIMLEQALGMLRDHGKRDDNGALIVPAPIAERLQTEGEKFKALIFNE